MTTITVRSVTLSCWINIQIDFCWYMLCCVLTPVAWELMFFHICVCTAVTDIICMPKPHLRITIKSHSLHFLFLFNHTKIESFLPLLSFLVSLLGVTCPHAILSFLPPSHMVFIKHRDTHIHTARVAICHLDEQWAAASGWICRDTG